MNINYLLMVLLLVLCACNPSSELEQSDADDQQSKNISTDESEFGLKNEAVNEVERYKVAQEDFITDAPDVVGLEENWDPKYSPNRVSVAALSGLIQPGQPEIPVLSLPEVENCPNGCCAIRVLAKSDYPKTTVQFPLVEPGLEMNCVLCSKDIDRLGTPMAAVVNDLPTFFCSTGCYSYLLSNPKKYLANYRTRHGFNNLE